MKLSHIESPALLLRLPVLEANILRMSALVRTRGLALRPHIKTHKTPEIARLQVEAGACGITVAKVSEAEVMVEAGIEDLCVATEVIVPEKLRKLMRLARRARVSLVVDSQAGIDAASTAACEEGIDLPVLIEIDTGQRRCGVSDATSASALARRIESAKNLSLEGVLTHEGHVYQCRSREELKQASKRAAEAVVAIAQHLQAEGYSIRTVSAGSAVSAPVGTAVAGVTEFRPGTYVFNDVRQLSLDACAIEDCAVSVLATVTSVPRAGSVVLDAGSKSIYAEAIPAPFSFDYSGYGLIKEYPGARIVSFSEEHAVVDVSRSPRSPRIGERVEVIPNHVCTTANLHDELLVLRGEDVIDVWKIAARGKVR